MAPAQVLVVPDRRKGGTEKRLVRVDEQHRMPRGALRRPNGPHVGALRVHHLCRILLGGSSCARGNSSAHRRTRRVIPGRADSIAYIPPWLSAGSPESGSPDRHPGSSVHRPRKRPSCLRSARNCLRPVRRHSRRRNWRLSVRRCAGPVDGDRVCYFRWVVDRGAGQSAGQRKQEQAAESCHVIECRSRLPSLAKW